MRRDRARGSGNETEGEVVPFGASESDVFMSSVRRARLLTDDVFRASGSPSSCRSDKDEFLEERCTP